LTVYLTANRMNEPERIRTDLNTYKWLAAAYKPTEGNRAKREGRPKRGKTWPDQFM
jgi:hypothetical protein